MTSVDVALEGSEVRRPVVQQCLRGAALRRRGRLLRSGALDPSRGGCASTRGRSPRARLARAAASPRVRGGRALPHESTNREKTREPRHLLRNHSIGGFLKWWR